jgi:surfactin family lipopeptide synthetase C
LALKVSYDVARFEAATIIRLLGHLQTVLAGMAVDPGRRLGELPLLPEAEWQQVMVEWNGQRTDAAVDHCLHHQLEAQVEQTPEAIAVAFEQEQLSYRALNRRVNQLAHHLQRLGVGPEVLVGVYV